MLNICAQTFGACSRNAFFSSQFTRNILIESFCVHLRNLIDFSGQKKEDYITYEDFVLPRKSFASPYNKLKDKYNKKINNLLSHLTFERLRLGDDKYWDLLGIANEVNGYVIHFLHVTDKSLLGDNMRAYQKQLSHEETKQDNILLSTTSDVISCPTIVSHHREPTTFNRT